MGIRKIKFTDGTSIEICGDSNMAPKTIYEYSRACFLYRDVFNNYAEQWHGIKTDYDGNTWKIENNSLVVTTSGSVILASVTIGTNKSYVICYVSPQHPNQLCFVNLTSGSGSYNYIDGLAYAGATGIQTFQGRMIERPGQETRNCITSDFKIQWYMGNNTYVGGPGAGIGGTYVNLTYFKNSYVETTDPYDPGGSSDLAGGTGDFDGSSTPIDFPSLPTLSAVDTGLISLFNPSVAEIKALATYMWGPPFDMENWKKLFANPMDAILGLSIVPVHVPDGGQETVKVGNIDTNISMNKAGSQYTEVDCGSLNVNEYWGAYLDYEPYTHVQLYLPYIGVKEISADDVMSKSVHIKYHVDILSGACIAYVKCGESVLYSFTGQCAASIPVTGRDYTGVVQSAISLVSSVMGTVAMTASAGSLGAAAGLAKSAASNARLSAASTRMAIGAGSGIANMAADAINITKPVIQKSASISSAAGILGIQTPYMILTRPRQCLPENQNRFIGYPSLITSPLSSLSGFARIEAIHLENIGATDEEIAEIESILHSGVIF